jgi:hypothetical protein
VSTPALAAGPAPGAARPPGRRSCPAPKPHLATAAIDGETVVYDPEADVLHRLDGPSSVVWSRLDGQLNLGTLAGRLAAEYDAAPTTVRRDVLDLAGVLWECGLLAGSEARPPAPVRRALAAPGTGPLSAPPGALRLAGRTLPDAPYTTRCRRALGHAFQVATNSAKVRDYLDEVFAGLPETAAAAGRYRLLSLRSGADGGRYFVDYDDEPITATGWLDRALAVLLWHVNQEVVRRSAGCFTLVHAAAAVRGGAAVLLPAHAESGKTTTMAGLVRAGFDYLTDEAVAIDPATLLAQPYAKSLSVDRGSWEVLADLRPPHGDQVAGQWQLPPGLIRPGAISGPAPVRFVVAPAYRRGAITCLQQVSRGEMLVTLADSTFEFQAAPQANLTVLARVLAGSECYRLTIGDLDHAVRLIDELVTPL